MKLFELKVNQKAVVVSVDTACISAKRLIEIGFSSETEVEKVINGISKNLNAYKVKNTVVALRNDITDKINVLLISGGNYGK